MKLTKQEVEHFAGLARLELKKKEKEKFRSQLSSILNWVKNLQKVDLTRVEPTAQVTGLLDVTREDRVEGCDKKTREKLIKLAPETKDNLIKVKSVF